MEKTNKLIAEFIKMEYTDVGWYDSEGILSQFIYDTVQGNCHDTLHFHESWDWLMSVLEKIATLELGDDIVFVKYAYPRTFGMIEEETGKLMVRLNGFSVHTENTLIESTYVAIVEFIKWYNNDKDKSNSN